MRIRIDAIDTLFFKDGKPFNMGDETWADGMFPPPLSVVAGALRTAWFSYHPGELPKAGGPDDPTAGLKITGMAALIDGQIHFPAPLDMVVDNSEPQKSKRRLYNLQITEPIGVTSSPLKKVLTFPKEVKVEPAQGLLIDGFSFSDWLNGRSGKTPFISQNEFVHTEAKTGIGRENRTRSVVEGKLYRVGMKRPASVRNGVEAKFSLVVEFSGLDLPKDGFFKLGGEGKIARWNSYEPAVIPGLPEIPAKEGKVVVKLYLLTPGIFNNGSIPDIPGISRDEVIAASIGKAIHTGGYDMKNGQPKPMKLAVPAGAVYYLEIDRIKLGDILSLHGTSLSEGIYAQQGFGIILTGGYNA